MDSLGGSKKWIQTHGEGGVDGSFDYERPHLFTWPLPTVAHHLSNLNRYTGAASRTYSVAEHSWRVALYAADLAKVYGGDAQVAAREGICHDIVECVIGDVNSPLKSMPFMAGFKKYEADLQLLVQARFKTSGRFWVTHDGKHYDIVRCADLAALDYERAQLLGKPPMEWSPFPILPAVPTKAFDDCGMPARDARELFLTACAALGVE
jgi:hypothetical protein